MAAGMHPTNLVDNILDALANASAWSEPGMFVKLHTGDPGAAGTANASAETTRLALGFAAASGGSVAENTQPQWSGWSAGTEGITHLSLWNNLTAGSFLWSVDLGGTTTVNDGDDLTISSLSISFTPLAA